MNKLRLLIVDCYSLTRRLQFFTNNMPFASKLFTNIVNHYYKDKFDYDIIYPGNATFEIPDMKYYSGVIWTGSSYSVYNNHEYVMNSKILLDEAIENQVNCYGSCYGFQLFADRLGGKVEKSNKGREIGIIRDINIVEDHYIYKNKKKIFNTLGSHSDSVVDISPYGKVLSYNNFSIQAGVFNVNNTELVGVQYHPEYDLDYFFNYMKLRKNKLIRNNNFDNGTLFDIYINGLKNRACLSNRNIFGITDDVIIDDIRRLEILNWLNKLLKKN